MPRSHSLSVGFILAVVVLAFAVPLLAQEAAPVETPTAKNPLRFNAVGVSMEVGGAKMVQIAIERWSTDEERQALLKVLAEKGQNKLVDALQDIKERNGYLRLPNSPSVDLKYSREHMLPDGTRQIVIVTDKPVSFLAARSNARTMDYPFTVVEMRFAKGEEKGEGRLLAMTALSIKNGRLELENYGQEPVRLTSISEEKKK